MSEESGKPTVHAIGMNFVSRYYNVWKTTPEHLHKFYKDDSNYTYGFEGENPHTARGKSDIQEKIEQLKFKDVAFHITNTDSQPSLNDSVVVVVQGYFSNDTSISRRFTQTFVLAVQPKGYYVLNDVFRFVSNDIPIPSPRTSENGEANEAYENDSTSATVGTFDGDHITSGPESDYPVSDFEKEENTSEPLEAPAKEESKPQPEAAVEETEDAEKKAKKKAKKKKKAAKETPVATGPTTWASITGGPSYVPPPQPQAPKKEQPKETKEQPKEGKREYKTREPRDTKPRDIKTRESREGKEPREEKKFERPPGVFVAGLPAGVTDKDLVNVFSKYGEVIKVSILPHNSAYVDYKDASAVPKTLEEADKISIAGKQITVNEKRKTVKSFGRGGPVRKTPFRSGSYATKTTPSE